MPIVPHAEPAFPGDASPRFPRVALTGCGARRGQSSPSSGDGRSDNCCRTAEGGEPTTGPVETLDATPTPEPTTGGDIVLRVWMPEPRPHCRDARSAGACRATAGFDTKYPDYDVEVHVKLTTGPGSAIAYLRSARGIAPGILPDLVLLNLEALALAANDELEPVNIASRTRSPSSTRRRWRWARWTAS